MTGPQFTFAIYQASHFLPHGERPTEPHLRVGRLLARWQHPCPSHAKLARAARVCVRTVQNALNRFRALGMLDWQHQGATMRSGRRLRLPNRYLFKASFLLLPARAKEERGSTLNPKRYVGKLLEMAFGPRPHPPIRTVAEQLELLRAG